MKKPKVVLKGNINESCFLVKIEEVALEAVVVLPLTQIHN